MKETKQGNERRKRVQESKEGRTEGNKQRSAIKWKEMGKIQRNETSIMEHFQEAKEESKGKKTKTDEERE